MLTCVVILAAERNKEFAAGRNIFEEEGDASVMVSDFGLEMDSDGGERRQLTTGLLQQHSMATRQMGHNQEILTE